MTITAQRPTADQQTSHEDDRFVASALFGLAALLALYQVVTAPFIPVLTVFTIVYAAVGIGLWRAPRRWLRVVAGVVAAAYLVGAAPVFIEHFAHPESPLGFVIDSLLLIGLGLVIVGVVRALRGAGPGRRPLLISAGTLAVAAAAVSLIAAAGVDSDARQPEDLALEVADWIFPDITVPASTPALWVDNQDPFHHTFVVEDTGIHQALPASTAVRIPLDLAPGTYTYLCDVPGHEEMRGELVVR
jgi:plastocyanin